MSKIQLNIEECGVQMVRHLEYLILQIKCPIKRAKNADALFRDYVN